VIFFTKPGYQAAYQSLTLKTYPLAHTLTIKPNEDWQEVRLLHTVLGHHLIVKHENTSHHLDPITFEPWPVPNEQQLINLVSDATTRDQARYGDIMRVDGNKFITNTGVEISLNWQTLTLRQSGEDTRLINLLYKIHYLQWTPYSGLNKVLGIVGLMLLLGLTVLGTKIYLAGRKKAHLNE
jgi:hypothetical protein